MLKYTIAHMSLCLDSGRRMVTKPPMAMMTAVTRMGIALLTEMKLPNVTLPNMAAMRPRHVKKPNPVDLEEKVESH